MKVVVHDDRNVGANAPEMVGHGVSLKAGDHHDFDIPEQVELPVDKWPTQDRDETFRQPVVQT
jgi:hypothetical protein